MQDPNLSQVSLWFFNVVRYGTQLFPGCNLASMIQRGFKALDAKCSTSGKFRFCISSLIDIVLSPSLPEPSVERCVNLFVLLPPFRHGLRRSPDVTCLGCCRIVRQSSLAVLGLDSELF